jgi:hypothetical protein
VRRNIVALLIMSLLAPKASPAASVIVEGQDVLYVGGTLPGLREGVIGRFHTDNEKKLIFEHSAGRAEIPYEKVISYHVSQELARRLGVVATIVVVLVKHRQRRHMVEIVFLDGTGTRQAAVFEFAKGMEPTIAAVLRARIPPPCPPKPKGESVALVTEPPRCRHLG